MKLQIGLKAWTTNIALIPEAVSLHDHGDLEYVELFCVPGTARDTHAKWRAAGIPFVIHAPHALAGLNLARPEMRKNNERLVVESLYLADVLRADMVIFHPGVDGAITETVNQARQLIDSRMVFENKPFLGLNGEKCVGSTVAEIRTLCGDLHVRFCLDFGHATAAANSLGVPPLQYARSFLELKPSIFHLSDGDFGSELDHHERYGQGSFPIQEYLRMIPHGGRLTNESRRANPESAIEYVEDRQLLTRLLRSIPD